MNERDLHAVLGTGVGHKNLGAVTRSFFEFARPAPPPRPRWGIQTVHRQTPVS
jgi:hypothetical protein